ncbi:MAG: hypothetical protein R3C58_09610 [Parvularculaceae bacterium]
MTPDLIDADALARLLKPQGARRKRLSDADAKRGLQSAVAGLAAVAVACEVAQGAAEAKETDGAGEDFAAAPVAASVEDLLAFGGNCVPGEEEDAEGTEHDHGSVGTVFEQCASPFASPFANKYANARNEHEGHDADAHAAHIVGRVLTADAAAHDGHAKGAAAHSGHDDGHGEAAGASAHGAEHGDSEEAHADHEDAAESHEHAAPSVHGASSDHGTVSVAESDHRHFDEYRFADFASADEKGAPSSVFGDDDAIDAFGDLSPVLGSPVTTDPHAGHGVSLAALDLPPVEDLSAFAPPAI